MTVAELIAELQKVPGDATVVVAVADAQDTAYSKAEVKVAYRDGTAEVSAWVASDDEEACAPWSCD